METEAAPKKTRAKKVKMALDEQTFLGKIAEPLKTISASTELFDWKSLIPSKYIEINNAWYAQNGINPRDATEEQKEELKERAGEENLIIKLAGFKHLAHLRGIRAVNYRVDHTSEKHVTAICSLNFSECHVTDKGGEISYFPPCEVMGVANATELNTSYPFSMYLESMAENRSFIRAVKTAFNINILGAEELQIQGPATAPLLDDSEGTMTPQDSLQELLGREGNTFADLKESLRKKSWPGHESWNDFADVPAVDCFSIIQTINAKKKSKATA